MTHDELAQVEEAEQRDALRELLKSGDFLTLMTAWLVTARDARLTAAITPEEAPHASYLAGRASVINELYEWIEGLDPIVALDLRARETAHVRRRNECE